MERMQRDLGNYVDEKSKCSNRMLLALTWLAVNDMEEATNTIKEIKKNDDIDKEAVDSQIESNKGCLIEALYEIQREYNIDANHDNVDDFLIMTILSVRLGHSINWLKRFNVFTLLPR
jgi:hypothetical protein